MKFAATGLFCVWLVGSTILSAQSPDFSGTWTMDLTRSDAANQGAPIAPVTVVIRQSRDEVVVETVQEGKTDLVTYLPTGSKPLDARGVVGTFRWDGARLITNLIAHVNGQAVTIQESRALNPDGSEMAVDVTLVVEHGYQSYGSSVVNSSYPPNWAKGKNVFVKAR